MSRAGASGWLKLIQLTLACAVDIAQDMRNVRCSGVCCVCDEQQGHPVVVHESDGWDLTAVVTSLVQLILDPHFRSIHGCVCQHASAMLSAVDLSS